MHFSGSLFGLDKRKLLHPYSHPHLARNPVHFPPALRASDLQVCPYTTLSPHIKTGAHLREHRFNLHVMWRSEPERSQRRCDPQLVPACTRACIARHLLRTARLPAARARLHPRSHPQPALMRSARRRPWKHAQRTVAPAQEHSHQRLKPYGKCARPHQDGFHHRSEALQ